MIDNENKGTENETASIFAWSLCESLFIMNHLFASKLSKNDITCHVTLIVKM